MKFLNKVTHNLKNNSQRPSISRWFGNSEKGKQLEKEERETEARDRSQTTDSNPEANYTQLQAKALKRQLRGPAKFLVNGREVSMYAHMKTNPKSINSNAWMCFAVMALVFIAPLFYTKATMPVRLIAGIVLAIGVYYVFYTIVKSNYKKFAFKNELRFNTIITVLDLSELKRGFSINALLSATSRRFDKDKTLSNSISTLNSRIEDKPESPRPYLDFANEFSTTQRARLFMLAVYRMAQGNYDDSQIKSIKHSAAKDLTFQSEKIMHKKLKRYNKLNLWLFAGFVIYFVIYVLFFIALFVFRTLRGAM